MADVDRIIDKVTASLPGVLFEELRVTHAADDDGIWFFQLAVGGNEVQIESSTGDCPFLIEHNASDESYTATSVSDASAKVIEWLQLS